MKRPTCITTGKLQFRTAEEAGHELSVCLRKAPKNPRRRECRAYYCAECGSYHLTSKGRGR